MSDDPFRKIERSKPPASAPLKPREPKRMRLRLGRLFHRRRLVLVGLTIFFVLGASIGGFLGSLSNSNRTKPESPAKVIPPATTPPARPGNAQLRVYAITTPQEEARDAPKAQADIRTPRTLSPKPPENDAPAPKAASISQSSAPPASLTKAEAGGISKSRETNLAYAPPLNVGDQTPLIAIVIDDLGIDQVRTRRIIDTPGPLTLAFLPYGYNLRTLTAQALERGHELFVHLPMQPEGADADPGPNALLRAQDLEEIRSRIAWNLSQFDGFVGVNNHMGSDFTTWEEGMSVVLREIDARGLFYLDSLTSPRSVAKAVSARESIPIIVRDVFLDNIAEGPKIRIQLEELERISRQRGEAIGIGHPYDATVDEIRLWMPSLKDKGIKLVPLSVIQRRRSPRG